MTRNDDLRMYNQARDVRDRLMLVESDAAEMLALDRETVTGMALADLMAALDEYVASIRPAETDAQSG